MKNLRALFIAINLFCITGLSAKAQEVTATYAELIKQGVALHNQGKFNEAIDKFAEILKTDPDNAYANYEMAFSMYGAKRTNEALSHIDKATKATDPKLHVAALCLLATIYDDDKQSQKAIETYKLGIQIDATYPQIYYNLAVTYSHNQQYLEAETACIEAIKHNPKHASSQRLYALATFHQNKRVNALLGFCSFLLLEPTGPRAAEAYGNIQHIIQGGVLKDDKGNNTVVFTGKDDKETSTLNMGISLAVLSGQTKKLQGVDLLEYQLKSIFSLAGQLAEKKTDKSFFDKYFVAYFYRLAQSTNMSTFAHTVTLTDKTIDNATWAKANTAQINAMSEWLKATERSW